MRLRLALLGEIVAMALATIRANKLRSGLTVLGIVIGITALVGMTSLIRGLDQALSRQIREVGPNVLYVAKFAGRLVTSRKEFLSLMNRPDLTPEDAEAIGRLVPEVKRVDMMAGAGPGQTQARITYRSEKTRLVTTVGTTAAFPEVNNATLAAGRFYTDGEATHGARVVVLGAAPARTLFPQLDPIDKLVRIDGQPYRVVGVLDPRPDVLGSSQQDELALIPFNTHRKQFGTRRRLFLDLSEASIMIVVLPYDDASVERTMSQVEEVMRIRHGLRADDPDNFDIVTQASLLDLWKKISQAFFLALVVISSIALMVGGIGVMAIMLVSVTERTREIGVRKALGARRRDILWQFLIEAATLTSAGGLIGVLVGSSLGLLVAWLTRFPISLPWWSFALGVGFSSLVGLSFGFFPAAKASRLDPIEALRYE